MFEVLSLVVALFGVCLVASSPVGPVVDVAAWMVWVGQRCPEPPDFVAGQRDQLFSVVGGAPFWLSSRSVWAVTARNAAASMDRVMCRYQAS